MSAFDTHPAGFDDDSQTLHSQRIWKAAGKQDLDFDSQRLRNRLRAKMFGVDASPVKIGRYAVLETVGSGGMGVVYAAYDEELDRRVAVKLLRSSREEDASVGKGRLQREAQALAKLSHPNVVQVYEVGTFDDRVFLAMEFLAGFNLRTWLLDGRRPWQDILRCFIEAGQGLAAAHREGIIHRDFKPANVLFGGDGRVRVVDFGLARASEHARAPRELPSGEFKEQAFAIELTQTGEIMGTPAYMSPEQARYEGIDARSDQYSYCVALYEALFGRRPYVGNSTAEVLVEVAEGKAAPPPRNTKVPARIVRAIMRGLSLRPADRFATMEALLAELSFEDYGRWRWFGGGALVLASLGAYAYVGVGQPQCPSFAAALADSWGADHRAAVQASFIESGAPRAQSVAKRVTDRLDVYADEWLDARRDACDAHRVRHEQSGRLHDQRVACLNERKVELATLASVFANADPSVVEQAPLAVAELSSVAECGDFERMSAAAEGEPVREELRLMLAEIRAQHKAGLYEEALAGVTVVVDHAREDEVGGFEAKVRLQQALIQERRRAFGLAAEAVEQALDLAEVAADDQVAARAWSRLARYQARLGQPKLAEYTVRRARAKVRRLADEPDLLLEVRESEALTAWQAGRHDEAIESQIVVVEYHREHHGEHDPRTADAERRLANMLGEVGRHDEAQARYERARSVIERSYGPEHPMVAHVVFDAAVDHLEAGRPLDARERFLEAERLFVAALGPDAPTLLTVHKALASIAFKGGELEEADRRADLLLELSEGPGASAADRPDALNFKAGVASRRQKHEEAVENYQEYLALTGVDSLAQAYRLHRIGAYHNIGHNQLAMGHIEDAEEALQQALDLLTTGGADDDDEHLLANLRANIWLTMGECARARGKSGVRAYEEGLQSWSDEITLDPEGELSRAKLRWVLARGLGNTERARQLARDARLVLDGDERAEIDAWLEAQPRRPGA